MNTLALGKVFVDNGIKWRVSAIAETFYIATREDIGIDVNTGEYIEPGSSLDIIKVMK